MSLQQALGSSIIVPIIAALAQLFMIVLLAQTGLKSILNIIYYPATILFDYLFDYGTSMNPFAPLQLFGTISGLFLYSFMALIIAAFVKWKRG